jgi:hypothetical protein
MLQNSWSRSCCEYCSSTQFLDGRRLLNIRPNLSRYIPYSDPHPNNLAASTARDQIVFLGWRLKAETKARHLKFHKVFQIQRVGRQTSSVQITMGIVESPWLPAVPLHSSCRESHRVSRHINIASLWSLRRDNINPSNRGGYIACRNKSDTYCLKRSRSLISLLVSKYDRRATSLT